MIAEPSKEADHHLVPIIRTIKTIKDPRGSLGVIEAFPDTGFVFKRFYFLYNTTTNEARGHHAHKNLRQCIIAINGSFQIVLEDRDGGKFEFNLSTPEEALIVPAGYWRELNNFSHDAICLVAASEEYEEADYIRDYEEFKNWRE